MKSLSFFYNCFYKSEIVFWSLLLLSFASFSLFNSCSSSFFTALLNIYFSPSTYCSFFISYGIFYCVFFYLVLIFFANSPNLLMVSLILSIYKDILSSWKSTLDIFKSLELTLRTLYQIINTYSSLQILPQVTHKWKWLLH